MEGIEGTVGGWGSCLGLILLNLLSRCSENQAYYIVNKQTQANNDLL